MHLVELPLSFIGSSITPFVESLAMNVVVFELSSICGAIRPVELSVSMFLAF
jgi:hypothetical protein